MYGKNLKRFFIFIFFIQFPLILSGQADLILTLDKLDKGSECFLNWMDDFRFFAVSGKNIFIADTKAKKIINAIHLSEIGINGLHFNTVESGIMFCNGNTSVTKWSFKSLKSINIYNTGENFIPESVAVSPDNKIFAAGFKNGFVKINAEFKLQEADFKLGFKLHKGAIKTIGFNYNGQYIFTAGEDNKIKILDSDTLEVFKEFDFNGKAKLPVVFSPKNNDFASCTGLNTISVRDINGIKQIDIKTEHTIKNFKYTENGSYLAVLINGNKLYFYETSTGKPIYLINPPVQKNILDFSLHRDSKHILEIFENGEVYLTKLSETYKIKEKTPEQNKPEDAALIEKIQNISSSEEKITQSENIAEEKNIDDNTGTVNNNSTQKVNLIGYKKSKDAFELRSGFNTAPNKYFIGNLSFNAGYYFNGLLSPFYFGVESSFGTAFPKKQFPYDYYLNGEKIHAPYLISIGFYLPVGFGIKPFAHDFRFTAELSPGIQIKRLWNGSSKQAVYGKFFAAPSALLSVGFSYKWLGLQAGVNYDKIFNFSFMIQVLFRIEMPETERIYKKAPHIQKERNKQ